MIAAALLYAWIQYGADGAPHVRVISGAQRCPTVTVDGVKVHTTMRVGSNAAFAPPLCDAPITERATNVRVGSVQLPKMPSTVNRIAVFGDSGCRIKVVLIQNCNDPAAWPFARIARSIARDHPDLIVHVGDYLYRETACLPFDRGARTRPTATTGRRGTSIFLRRPRRSLPAHRSSLRAATMKTAREQVWAARVILRPGRRMCVAIMKRPP